MRNIGGNIELNKNLFVHKKKDFLNNFNIKQIPHSYVNSGRSALFFLLKNKKKNILHCPEYICLETFNLIFKKVKTKVLFYDVDLNLKIKKKKLFEKLKNNNIDQYILLTNYFGIVNCHKIGKEIAARFPHVKIILDSVHNLWDLKNNHQISKWADYQFYSFSKFLPVPDGGILLGKEIKKVQFNKTNISLNHYLKASKLKNLYNKYLVKKSLQKKLERSYLINFKLANKHKETINQKPNKNIVKLLDKFDYNKIKKIRKKNFSFLHKKLKKVEGIKLLKFDGNYNLAPMNYPIFVKNRKKRDTLKKYLEEKKIYCPIYWPQKKEKKLKFKNTYRLISSQLSLPIDQRYNFIDMKRLSAEIKFFFDKNYEN